MRDWTIKGRIIAAFTMVAVVILALAVFATQHLNAVEKEVRDIANDSLPGLATMAEVSSSARAAYTLTMKRLASNDPNQQRGLDASIQANAASIDGALLKYEGAILNDEDRRLFATLKAALQTYRSTDQTIRNVEAAGRTPALNGTFDAAAQQLWDSIEKEVAYNHQIGESEAREALHAVHTTKKALLFAPALALLIAIVSGIVLINAVNNAINRPLSTLLESIEVMRRGDLSKRVDTSRKDEFRTIGEGLNRFTDDLISLIGDIQKTGIQVNTSATEIAATSREQQSTANEIAATTAEIGATSREISATSKELSRTMNNVTNVAEKTAAVAGSGQAGLARMEQTIGAITTASTAISAKLAVLNEKAGNISSVITTISKVADQTNLLSLNAAIEAEKAGEYGRGFSVVATEIRRLADQTAAATHDIEQMIKQMQSAVSAGVMGMDKFSEEVRRGVEVVRQVSGELGEIIDQVQTLAPTFESVNEGMEAQSVAAQQISESLSQLTEAAQQTVDSLRQSNVAIEQLSGVTRILQTGVSRFTLRA